MEIIVNNTPVEAHEGETILTALKRAGIQVPTLCHLEGLFPSGACRMCVVEVEGMPNLAPSCAFPARDGMKIQTHSPRVVRARKTIVELLLSNHPDDCLYCGRNTECELQELSAITGVRMRRYQGARNEAEQDVSSPSITRDPDKCILCGRCVRVCEENQAVAAIDFIGRGSSTRVGTAFDQGLNVSSCINCGQCITVCPTGALIEHHHLKPVIEALNDPEKVVVVQHAPAVSVSLAESFGLKPGADVNGKMVGALRALGFDKVFDTSFAADLTIMEEGSELVQRLQEGGRLPMMTSCSPGWIKYVEEHYPDMIGNLSTCKSPQQMLGAVIKTFWAGKTGVAPENIYSVSIMPCTAKKFEAGRAEMTRAGEPDIDAVLTTRELALLMKMRGLNIESIKPDLADSPLGARSTAGKLFGATGGVMEAAIRSAHYLVTGEELDELKVTAVRGLEGVKEARVKINGTTLGVAVASGLGNARKLIEQVRNGRDDLHFIEVMTCPGGCVNGGGQPRNADPEAVRKRMQALYKIDREEALRVSHKNEEVRALYQEFLGEPLGHKSHELLHTAYEPREVLS